MKPTTIRFSEEITKQLVELALAEAIIEQRQVSNSEMLRRLIHDAHNTLKGK